MFTRFACFALILCGLASCDYQGVKIISCALSDEKLAVAIKDPLAAKTYLKALQGRLKGADPKAIEEAGDLAERLAECIQ